MGSSGLAMRELLVVIVIYAAVIALFTLPALILGGCASQGLQETWQDCAGVSHQECWDSWDSLACEYEYYKECINE